MSDLKQVGLISLDFYRFSKYVNRDLGNHFKDLKASKMQYWRNLQLVKLKHAT